MLAPVATPEYANALLQITTGTLTTDSTYADPFAVTWNFTQGPGKLGHGSDSRRRSGAVIAIRFYEMHADFNVQKRNLCTRSLTRCWKLTTCR